MATWYYRGRTPTPVDTIDRGSVVITAKSTFQATDAQVAHLLRAGLVVRMKDAPAATSADKSAVQATTVAEADGRSLPPEPEVSAPVEVESDTGTRSDPDVVEESAEESTAALAADADAEAGPADGDPPSPVEEEKQSGSTRKRRRNR